MKIRVPRIPNSNRLILALLLLLASPAMATVQDGNAAKPSMTFAVIGDAGTGDEAQMAVARAMIKQRDRTPFDFAIMLGDNIYGGGKPKYFKPRFEEPYKDLLAAGFRFYAALGNHDAPNAEAHVKYDKFNMGGRRYYSFTKGVDGDSSLVEFFAIDSNSVMPEQLAWLEEGLKASKAQWKVAYFHHSIYSSSRMHPPYLKLRAQLEPLFVKYQVKVVFAGHSHCYERVKPQQGVHYFTEGASGEIKRKTLDRQSPFFAAGNDEINSFLLVQVNGNEMKVDAIGADGSSIDSSTIKRNEKD